MVATSCIVKQIPRTLSNAVKPKEKTKSCAKSSSTQKLSKHNATLLAKQGLLDEACKYNCRGRGCRFGVLDVHKIIL